MTKADLHTAASFCVGEWVVTPRRCTLERGNESAHVKPKTMAVLQCLANARGGVVTRDELFEAVWPNIAVSDDVLTQSIVELRKAVGDSPQAPTFIETVPRVGFRLIPAISDTKEPARRFTGRRWVALVAVFAMLGLALFAYIQQTSQVPSVRTIAVLPLDSLSDDPDQAFFARGITDLLTTELSQIVGLGVISRTSADNYGDSDKSLPQIGSELGADALIEGTVQADDDEVLINLQLIDARSDRHLWSRPYRRRVGDVLTVQGEVVREIADEIAIAVDPQLDARLGREREAEPEAIREWMLGYHFLHQSFQEGTLEKATARFENAVRLDPEFAQAHASLAIAYVFEGMWMGTSDPNKVLPLAISSAHRALDLDPSLADAHFALAKIHRLNWQWDAAEQKFRRGRDLQPSNASGLISYANFLTAMGRFEEAIEIALEAVRLDPLGPIAHNELAFAYWMSGDVEESHRWFERSIDIDPDFRQTELVMPYFYLEIGQPDKALALLDKMRGNLDDYLSLDIGYAAITYADMGHRERATELLNYLLERKDSVEVRAFAIALAYYGLDDYDKTLDWLEQSHEERNLSLHWLKNENEMVELRDHPRFVALLENLDFPD